MILPHRHHPDGQWFGLAMILSISISTAVPHQEAESKTWNPVLSVGSLGVCECLGLGFHNDSRLPESLFLNGSACSFYESVDYGGASRKGKRTAWRRRVGIRRREMYLFAGNRERRLSGAFTWL